MEVCRDFCIDRGVAGVGVGAMPGGHSMAIKTSR